MKKLVGLILVSFLAAVIGGDLLFSPAAQSKAEIITVPFQHALHGDSLGLDCESCHTGAASAARAYMPAKTDCMDCHRLPLTENPGIQTLAKAFAKVGDKPWKVKSKLPRYVVFHHGVHVHAGISCETCHGSLAAVDRGVRVNFSMGECLKCHQGKMGFPKSSTNCAACHR